MDPHARAAKLEQAFEFVSKRARPTPSQLIAARVLDLKLRDKRQMRRAVRKLLSLDSRFQEVHAGHWETLTQEYGDQDLDDAQFRVLDLEVTGSDPARNAIIDLAVYGVSGAEVQPLLSTLVDPRIPIPPSIQRLTGIDQRMVRGAPDFEHVLPRLLEVLDGGIFVAHNATFDYHFLKTCAERITGTRFTAPHICTVKLSQRLLDPKCGSRKLHHLAVEFGIPLENRHRADDDAYATARILLELKRKLRERDVNTVGEMKVFESRLPAEIAAAAKRNGGTAHVERGAAIEKTAAVAKRQTSKPAPASTSMDERLR